MLTNRPYEQVIETQLSVQECAHNFKEIVEIAMSGFKNRKAARMAEAAGYNPGFYKPQADSSLDAFGGVLGDEANGGDSPAFEIAAYVPTYSGCLQGEGAHIHMYVWERGSSREVIISSRPTSRGHRLHASKLHGRMAEALA